MFRYRLHHATILSLAVFIGLSAGTPKAWATCFGPGMECRLTGTANWSFDESDNLVTVNQDEQSGSASQTATSAGADLRIIQRYQNFWLLGGIQGRTSLGGDGTRFFSQDNNFDRTLEYSTQNSVLLYGGVGFEPIPGVYAGIHGGPRFEEYQLELKVDNGGQVDIFRKSDWYTGWTLGWDMDIDPSEVAGGPSSNVFFRVGGSVDFHPGTMRIDGQQGANNIQGSLQGDPNYRVTAGVGVRFGSSAQ